MDVSTKPLSIGSLELHPAINTISVAGQQEIKVTPKVMELFIVLVNADESVLSRELLLEQVWPGRVGADESLTRAISDIRKHLKTLDPDAPACLVTVPKRGYQLKTSQLRVLFANQEAVNPKKDVTVQKQTAWLKIVAIMLVGISIIWAAMFAFQNANTQQEFEPKRILVIPFGVLGAAEEEVSAMANAVLEETIDGFARMDGISVASRTSSQYFADTKFSVDEIVDKLPVDLILEGSLKRVGSESTINYRLIDTATKLTLFANTVTVNNLDVTAPVNSVLTEVAEQLGTTYSVKSASPMSQEVYRLYLLAQNLRNNSYHLPAWQNAADYLERALTLAPNEPLILEALIDNYLEMTTLADESLSSEYFERAVELVKAAQDVAMNPAALAYYQGLISKSTADDSEPDLEQAMQYFASALKLGQQNYTLYFNYVVLLSSQFRYAEAVEVAKQGVSIHPLNYRLYAGLAYVYMLRNDIDSARLWFKKMREIAPIDPTNEWVIAFGETLGGNFATLFDFTEAMRVDGQIPRTIFREIEALTVLEDDKRLLQRWAYCERQELVDELCKDVALAQAIFLNDSEKLADMLNKLENVSELSPKTQYLILQALPYLTKQDWSSELQTKVAPIFDNLLDGRSFARLSELVPIVALYLNNNGVEFWSERQAYETFERTTADKLESSYMTAELAAVSGDFDKMYQALARAINTQEVLPTGRYYAYFDSPYFKPVRDDKRFQSLKALHNARMSAISATLDDKHY